MTDPFARFRRFLRELKRWKVYQVAGAAFSANKAVDLRRLSEAGAKAGDREVARWTS